MQGRNICDSWTAGGSRSRHQHPIDMGRSALRRFNWVRGLSRRWPTSRNCQSMCWCVCNRCCFAASMCMCACMCASICVNVHTSVRVLGEGGGGGPVSLRRRKHQGNKRLWGGGGEGENGFSMLCKSTCTIIMWEKGRQLGWTCDKQRETQKQVITWEKGRQLGWTLTRRC